jgi:hypothetical protein
MDAHIQVRDGRDKILDNEGQPRFEVGFLRRAVRDDENLQVVVLQRTGEDRFVRLDVDSGLLERIVRECLAKINPDDRLGGGSVVVPAPGTYFVTTTGGDCSITAEFDVSSAALPGEACLGDSGSIPVPNEPCFGFSDHVFDSLEAAVPFIEQMEVEPDNPGNVTRGGVHGDGCLHSRSMLLTSGVTAHSPLD